MMKFMYFLTLLMVALCAVLNLHGVMNGLWYSWVVFLFISVLFLVTLVFGIVHWGEL